MRSHPPENDLAHEHDWIPETIDVIWDENVHVIWSCGWAEVTSSTTSAKHDETFYGYGAECGATKRVTYRLAIKDSERDEKYYADEVATGEHDERIHERLWDENDGTIEAEVEKIATPHYPDGRLTIAGEYVGIGNRYTVILEKDNETVEEDWL
jgi:hypothetical protein